MKYPADIGRQRIYGRILERCVPIRVNRRDIRTMNAEKNVARMRELFRSKDTEN